MLVRHKKLVVGVVLLSMIACAVYVMQYAKTHYRQELLNNIVVQRMIPTYRSLRKLPDIVFMPWSAFAKSNLETYEISISPQDIERMNSALPQSPFNTTLQDESRLWVPAYFRTTGYEGKVKIRYRGNLPSHWNAYQKSYAIEFPKDNLFQGQRKINLIIPSDRRYIDMSLVDYRAEKLGLIHPDEKLIRMELNGADNGVLLAFEGWSQPWIEKIPISALSTIYGVNDAIGGTSAPSYREHWDSWNMEEPMDFEPLEALTEVIMHASDDMFAKLIPQLIDIEDWYAWETIHILASGYHGGGDTSFGANNLVLIFDKAEGRFKPVPYNTIIYTQSSRALMNKKGIIDVPPHLTQRILVIREFRARRDEAFTEYVREERADDLLFIENWKKKYNREFLLDNAKNDNHFMYLAKIKESVQAITDYFEDPYDMISITYNPPVEVKEELELPDSFKYLLAAGTNPFTASKQHPSLLYKDNKLIIPQGVHTFKKTIIIPANTQLVIEPGATLQMDDDVSFISYSPVIAEGTKNRPITISGYNANKPWGVFAVINAESSTSSLSYVYAENGSEATINGAYISGTLAFHNSNVLISSSTVKNAQGDDGINIKGSYAEVTNNTLIENSSDGIDLDYINRSSTIENNSFLGNKGDAIDISWSDIKITGNTVTNCGDKGISVGESSKPTIIENTISNCQIGIAIKDSSEATIIENTITNTNTAISSYQKKPYFGGGTATLKDNILSENKADFYTDSLSTITQLNTNKPRSLR